MSFVNKERENEINLLLRDKYKGVKAEEFLKDVDRLSNGEPLAYVIGWVPFFGAKIYLDSKPLIPRTETEYLVSVIAKEIENNGNRNMKILDLCAGSGCIGISLLKKFPSLKVDFAEIDESHHETIRRNLRENNLDQNNSKIFGGDLFQNIPDSYDLIVSNPPYINPELSERIGASVLEHEPKIALFGGKDGIEIINKILEQAPSHLNENGVLYLEHEPEQVEHLSKNPMYIESIKDQYGVTRFSKF